MLLNHLSKMVESVLRTLPNLKEPYANDTFTYQPNYIGCAIEERQNASSIRDNVLQNNGVRCECNICEENQEFGPIGGWGTPNFWHKKTGLRIYLIGERDFFIDYAFVPKGSMLNLAEIELDCIESLDYLEMERKRAKRC